MSYSVVITSGNIRNLTQSVKALKDNQPQAKVIVVADRLPPDERTIEGVSWVEGVTPFNYAKNSNLGIKAAGDDDVILWNDDAILETPYGLDKLAEASENYGIVSASIRGRCGNPNQKKDVLECHTETNSLAFIAVYITRETIDRVGLLAEDYEIGTYEDNDYCKRALFGNIPLGICGSCKVAHNTNPSVPPTLSRMPEYLSIMEANKKKFEARFSQKVIRLSICICSLYSRAHYLARLLATLNPQLGAYTELLLAIDDGQENIGAKRQRLLESAKGEYVVSLDDDDLISPDYIQKVFTAIFKSGADCITYKSKRYVDGAFDGNCIYSLRNKRNGGHRMEGGIKTYVRFPYHVTPIKREIALRAGFPSFNFSEDTQFAEKVNPLLATEEFIDDFLYFYYWRSNKVTGG